MISDKTVLGVIPARGGSKGVPRKNIRMAGGKPLIAWTIAEALKSKYLDRLVLSSEDPEIMEVALRYGCDVPFRRPVELASDDTPGVVPIFHALGELPGYCYVVLLQPTSPLRTVEDIDGCIERCEDTHAKACVSVVKCQQHPYLMFSADRNCVLHSLVPEANNFCRRQDYPDFFLLNGAVYVAQTEWLQHSQTFISDETVGFEMPEERSLDIDTEADFAYIEMVAQKFG
ncbi:MAG: acylneuraminate cytidylyltransferase family protein [Terracidiphilus sp.]|nr:acylneuraminate cytidylyltransferase family protein [Terracidiphilus sp.]